MHEGCLRPVSTRATSVTRWQLPTSRRTAITPHRRSCCRAGRERMRGRWRGGRLRGEAKFNNYCKIKEVTLPLVSPWVLHFWRWGWRPSSLMIMSLLRYTWLAIPPTPFSDPMCTVCMLKRHSVNAKFASYLGRTLPSLEHSADAPPHTAQPSRTHRAHHGAHSRIKAHLTRTWTPSTDVTQILYCPDSRTSGMPKNTAMKFLFGVRGWYLPHETPPSQDSIAREKKCRPAQRILPCLHDQLRPERTQVSSGLGNVIPGCRDRSAKETAVRRRHRQPMNAVHESAAGAMASGRAGGRAGGKAALS